jgi:hypothetical protein
MINVILHPTVTYTAATFRDSEELLGIPENPNLDAPAGHSLPFPMALVSVPVTGDLTIEIQVYNGP